MTSERVEHFKRRFGEAGLEGVVFDPRTGGRQLPDRRVGRGRRGVTAPG